jgi:hypothetical protein
MPSLQKYFKVSTIIPFAITIMAGIILSLTHDGSSYKSEWFTDDGFVLTVVLTILLSGLISLLSLTLLLNKRPIFRNNLLLSFITWTLLPGIACLFVIYQETLNFMGHSNIEGSYEGNRLLDGYIISVAILHLISIFVSYVHFRFTSNSQTNENSR